MKQIIYKFFMDHEKEEAWINEMSAEGLAFIGMFCGFYRFEYTLPGEYVYRIELLENIPKHFESRKYITFMLENNIEPISSYNRWVYFRRKTEYGNFDLYSDIDSRLAYYRRLYKTLNPVMIVEFLVSIPWIATFFAHLLAEPSEFWERNFFLSCLFLGLGFALLPLCRSLRKKIKFLKQEKLLRE